MLVEYSFMKEFLIFYIILYAGSIVYKNIRNIKNNQYTILKNVLFFYFKMYISTNDTSRETFVIFIHVNCKKNREK